MDYSLHGGIMWYVIYIDKVVSKYKQLRNIKNSRKISNKEKRGKTKII